MKDTNNTIFKDEDFRKPPIGNNRKPLIFAGVMAGLLAIISVIFFIKNNPKIGDVIRVVDSVAREDIKRAFPPSGDSIVNEKDSSLIGPVIDRPNDKNTSENKNHHAQPSKIETDQMDENTVQKYALSVIRGNYGNNPVRRRRLGDRYYEVQNKVNEMYRRGEVY